MIIRLFFLLFFPLLIWGQTTNNFECFFKAISIVESGNNPKAFNKAENAAGQAQIRVACLKDSNEFGKTKYSLNDRFDPEKSKIICFNYLRRYAPRHNWEFEKMTKLWNCGPNWKKKEEKDRQVAKNLEIYWQKVKIELNRP